MRYAGSRRLAGAKPQACPVGDGWLGQDAPGPMPQSPRSHAHANSRPRPAGDWVVKSPNSAGDLPSDVRRSPLFAVGRPPPVSDHGMGVGGHGPRFHVIIERDSEATTSPPCPTAGLPYAGSVAG